MVKKTHHWRDEKWLMLQEKRKELKKSKFMEGGLELYNFILNEDEELREFIVFAQLDKNQKAREWKIAHKEEIKKYRENAKALKIEKELEIEEKVNKCPISELDAH
jgi:hypothetical protein